MNARFGANPCACGGLRGPLLGRRGLMVGAALLACGPARAQTAGPANPALVADLVVASHILFNQGVVDAFGHISARHDRAPDRFLMSRSMAPGLVTAADIMEFDLDGAAIDPRGRAIFLERFIHAEIYRGRPDVTSVVHSHSPSVIPFGITGVELRPVYHMSGFLGGGVPVFEIRDAGGPATNMLVSNAALGHALAATLGPHRVALMRGHGSVAVGANIRQATFRAVYTELNARMQAEALRLGPPTYLNDAEAAAANDTDDVLMGRAWELWVRQAAG